MAAALKDAGSLAGGGVLGTTQKKEIRSYAERMINLLKERDEINESLKEVANEAKEAGFDTKILRKAVSIVRKDVTALRAEQEMIDSYVEAIQPDLFSEKKAAA